MGLWNWIKGTAAAIAAPVVITTNAIIYLGDGDGYAAAMDNYFENGFSLKKSEAPTIDQRNKNINDFNNTPKPNETSAEKEARVEEENKKIKELAKECEKLNSVERNKLIKAEVKKRVEEQEECRKEIGKQKEELMKENAQLATKEKQARESGDLAGANKYRAMINGNLTTIRNLENALAQNQKNERQLEAQLKEIITKSNQSLTGNLNWGSYTTWITISGFLIALLVIYYFAKKLWNKLKGEQ